MLCIDLPVLGGYAAGDDAVLKSGGLDRFDLRQCRGHRAANLNGIDDNPCGLDLHRLHHSHQDDGDEAGHEQGDRARQRINDKQHDGSGESCQNCSTKGGGECGDPWADVMDEKCSLDGYGCTVLVMEGCGQPQQLVHHP